MVEVAAFSVPHHRLGEDVAAAVVLRPDAEVSAQKLRSFARERLASFKVPGLIQIVPEIPKSPAGKIKRDGLAAALSIAPSTAGAKQDDKLVPPDSELERQLAKIWADLLEFDQIGIDQDVFALGADSLTVTQMLSRLRSHFGIDLSFKDIFDAPTVAALAARIEIGEKGLADAGPWLSACSQRRPATPACRSSNKESRSQQARSDRVQLPRHRSGPSVRAARC